MSEILDRYRSIATTFGARIAGITAGQWDETTPCSEWNVRDLLNHVIGGGHMFTAGLRGQAMGDGAPPDFVTQAGHTRAYHDAIDGVSSGPFRRGAPRRSRAA